jgi:cation transport ATPase
VCAVSPGVMSSATRRCRPRVHGAWRTQLKLSRLAESPCRGQETAGEAWPKRAPREAQELLHDLPGSDEGSDASHDCVRLLCLSPFAALCASESALPSVPLCALLQLHSLLLMPLHRALQLRVHKRQVLLHHTQALSSLTSNGACRIAAIVEYAIKSWLVGSILIVVLVLNASIGWYETRKAGNAVAALKSGLKPEASCKRDGKMATLDAKDLVPGDCVLLGSGSAVPADCMVNEGTIEVDQAALTGARAMRMHVAHVPICACSAPGCASAKMLWSSSQSVRHKLQ